MARNIVVSFENGTSAFAFKKIERASLYGRKKRVALDANDLPCLRAAMTSDGEVIVRPGMTAQGYFDDSGQQYESGDLDYIDEDGNELPIRPSTLGVAQELSGPVDVSEVLNLTLKSLYRLEPDGVADELIESLQAGDVYRFPFNYRGDPELETGFLLHNQNGYFALIGLPATPIMLTHEVPDTSTVQEDDTDFDELDFDMM